MKSRSSNLLVLLDEVEVSSSGAEARYRKGLCRVQRTLSYNLDALKANKKLRIQRSDTRTMITYRSRYGLYTGYGIYMVHPTPWFKQHLKKINRID